MFRCIEKETLFFFSIFTTLYKFLSQFAQWKWFICGDIETRTPTKLRRTVRCLHVWAHRAIWFVLEMLAGCHPKDVNARGTLYI